MIDSDRLIVKRMRILGPDNLPCMIAEVLDDVNWYLSLRLFQAASHLSWPNILIRSRKVTPVLVT